MSSRSIRTSRLHSVLIAAVVALLPTASVLASHTPNPTSVTVAGSLGFATPLGYQTHMMVYSPGGYRFTDFLRIGIPMDIVCWIIAMITIPWVLPFTPN